MQGNIKKALGISSSSVHDHIALAYPTLKRLLEIDGVFAAGGFIRDVFSGEEVKDIDLFFESEEALEKCLSEIGHVGGYDGNVTTYHIFEDDFKKESTYQLVHKRFVPLEEAINDFDFDCIVAGFDGKTLHHGENFFSAIEQRTVGVNVITKPLSSLNRLKRYIANKWNVEEPYYYILDVMQDKNPSICLMGEWYEK